MSETTSGTPKLNAALAKAQKAMRAARKEKVNPHFKSKYADGAEVWAVWQEVGPDHGLAVLQRPLDAPAGFLKLGMTLLHDSGEERDCGTVTMKLGQDTPQGYGSALTYAARYIMKAVGVASDEDDDANAATGKPDAKPAPRPAAKIPPKVVEAAADEVMREIGALRLAAKAANAPGAVDALRPRYSALQKVMPVAEWTALGEELKARKAELMKGAA